MKPQGCTTQLNDASEELPSIGRVEMWRAAGARHLNGDAFFADPTTPLRYHRGIQLAAATKSVSWLASNTGLIYDATADCDKHKPKLPVTAQNVTRHTNEPPFSTEQM